VTVSETAAPSIATGPPLETLGALLGGPRVDDLLRRAVDRAPEKVALRAASRELTYAELDAEADGIASALYGALGGPGSVVALASVLDPAFATSFFGISRSGNLPALVNPLLRAEALVHVLTLSGARAAIVPPAVFERLVPVLDQLPRLELILLTHRDPNPGASDALLSTVDELVRNSAGTAVPPPAPGDEDAVACLQFTSGTTGPPKAVQLTHRNIVVNAAQTAHAHRLDHTSVLFNYLPTFHLMHLTIGVTSVATQVQWIGDDPAEAVDAAKNHGATHFYTLPMRLSRLAAHPRLSTLEAPSLHAFLSGGSAAPPPTVRALNERFGVPVAQGYGLQETSPSTHFDDLANPVTGSSGTPVAGTGCRIVDVETRAMLPIGARGEIQVRGPQLMKGYLGRDRAEAVDADGWFATGDVGYLDADGRLFVADRIKDVFKCDNWLVSPTEIERVLMRHPQVADCVVVDCPDEFSGAVAHGLVVSRDARAEPEEFARFVADQLPYYEHLRHVELVASIPRSPTGKVERRRLREQVHARHRKPTEETRRDTMLVFINRITVTGDVAEVERLLGRLAEHITAQPGFRSRRLYQAAENGTVFIEVVEWENAEAHRNAASGDGFFGPLKEIRQHATAEPGVFELRDEASTALAG